MTSRFLRVAVCLSLITLLLSGCLTRKDSVPSPRPGTTYKTPKKTTSTTAKGNRIFTDATTSPKDVHVSGDLLVSYATVLGVNSRQLNNTQLYSVIDRWMGTPHRLGGADGRGMDCSAFVGMVMKDVYGKSLPRTSKDMAQRIKRKYERQLKEGDLVFFSFGKRNIDHVGIYLHNNKFVHVSTSKGVIISDLHDSWYYKYFTRAGTVQ